MESQHTPFHEVLILGGWRVGVQDNMWSIQNREGTAVSLPEDVPPGLVTLLERAPADFAVELNSLLRDRGLDVRLVENFPLPVILRLGLEWPSEYWQALALTWVETLQCAHQVKSALEVTVVHGRTQRHRHRAKRLLKYAQRPEVGL